MKVLVTSGGTKIPIDRVRSITNMSKGTFGSKIAEVFMGNGHQVDFLMAKDSRMPTRIKPGMLQDVLTYVTFEEYENGLHCCLDGYPDIVILAAAVSDYGVENYVDGKIRSNEDELIIRLKKLPKLISKVRGIAPKTFIVGFKLLVDSTEQELKEAMYNSYTSNRLNMVIGNDLRDIKNDNHTLMILNEFGEWKSFNKKEHNPLEQRVYEEIVRCYNGKN